MAHRAQFSLFNSGFDIVDGNIIVGFFARHSNVGSLDALCMVVCFRRCFEMVKLRLSVNTNASRLRKRESRERVDAKFMEMNGAAGNFYDSFQKSAVPARVHAGI